MIFLRFFIFAIIGLAFANETKKMEIKFENEEIQHCSVTCPHFPSKTQHNPTCKLPQLEDKTTTITPSTTTTPPTSTPSTTTTPPTSTPSTTTTPPTSTPSTTTTPPTSTPSTTTTPPTSTPSTTTTPPTSTTSTTSLTPRSNLCGEIKKQVCLNGDPHYRTFDGSHFEYQGTCPHIFVERCNGTDDFDYFSVKVKNQKFGKVSVIQSAQIELFYQTIFINLDQNFYINGIKESYPFNLNVSLNQHISITRHENKISILSTNNNESGIQVYLDAHTLCVDIPDCPEYFGTDKLCGLAGSYNGYCGDDLVYRDKTMFEDQGYPCRYGNKVNKWANSWTTNDYFWPSKNKTCEVGVDIDTAEDRKCDDAIRVCEPIRSALKGIKAFAQCKVLDYSEIYSEYGKCVDHICEKNIPRCDALQKFADFCDSRLKDVQLKPWREALHCTDED